MGGRATLLLALLLAAACEGRKLHEGDHTHPGPCTPQQLHISLTGNPTEMRVQWKTAGGSCPSSLTSGPAEALLHNPMDPSLLRSHHGTQRSYSSRDMCAPPARHFGFGPTFLHSAVITGLQPQRRYFYQIEGGRPVEFAAPVPAGPRHSFRFLVFGDMGEGEHREAKSPGASRTVEQLGAEFGDGGAELALHIGDISYANGKEEIWDTFMESIERFARHSPYMVGTGNHEYDYERSGVLEDQLVDENGAPLPDASGETDPYQPPWGNFGNDSGGECGVQISRRFVMPDVSEFGYWSRNLSSAAVDQLLAAARGSGTSPTSSSIGGSIGSSGSSSGSGRLRNPTLGPDAAGFLASAAKLTAAGQLQQQQQGPGEGAAAAATAGAASLASDDGGSSRPALPNPPFWYSFSHGSVHFVVLSTEHNLAPGSRQYRWLERDLALVDRCLTPWVVLAMHRPMMVVYPHKSNRIVGDHLREQLEDLLNEYQVDLVLSGHVHSYSRTCNVLDNECIPADKGGMTHIIVGCAGRKLTDVSHAQEDWLEFAAVQFGFGRVTVDSGASLLFELVGDDGRVVDSVKLHNSRARQRGCGDGFPWEEAEGAAAGDGPQSPWRQQQQQQQQQQQFKGAQQAALHASVA